MTKDIKPTLLTIGVKLSDRYGDEESDARMARIWRAEVFGELEEYADGILLLDPTDTAETLHASLYGCEVAALIDCATKAQSTAESHTEPVGGCCVDGCCSVNFSAHEETRE